VKRIVERGKGTTYSEVRENEKIIEAPNTSRVNELVERILKVKYDLFSKAIYSEQNSLDYFLTIPRGQRMKKIDELLGIDKFEKARANASTLANKLLERKADKQSMIDAADLDNAEKIIQTLKLSVQELKSENLQLDSRLKEVTANRMRIDKDIWEARRLKESLEVLRREEKGILSLVEDTYSSLQNLEKNLKDHDKDQVEKNLRDISRFLSEVETMFRDEQRKYVRLQDQATKARTEVEVMKREKIDRLEKEIAEKLKAKKIIDGKKLKPEKIEKEIDAKRKLAEKFFAEIEVIKMKVDDLKETIEEMNKIESKCPLCNSKITKEKKIMLIKKKKFEIENLKEKFVKAAKNRDINQKEADELQQTANEMEKLLDSIRDLDKLQEEMSSSKNIYEVLKEQSDNFAKELESAMREVESIEKKMTDARGKKEMLEVVVTKVRDYNEKTNKIQSLLAQRKQIETSIRAMENSLLGKDNSQLESVWKDLVTEEKTIAGRIKGIVDVIGERESRLRELEMKMSGAMKVMEEVRKLEKLAAEVKTFSDALEMTQEKLRREFVVSVNYTMNELWPNLYPYQDFQHLQLAIDEGDYVMQLQERSGKWVNVEGFASGGERSIAALTLRIAFALVLAPQLKWLVLDEPTANMDTKAVEDLAVTLSEHIGDFIEQTFLITHDEKLEGAVTGYAYRLERDKANDGFTKVVPIF
jgi:exonuclease SbcC